MCIDWAPGARKWVTSLYFWSVFLVGLDPQLHPFYMVWSIFIAPHERSERGAYFKRSSSNLTVLDASP